MKIICPVCNGEKIVVYIVDGFIFSKRCEHCSGEGIMEVIEIPSERLEILYSDTDRSVYNYLTNTWSMKRGNI